jgi:hypothetical protein
MAKEEGEGEGEGEEGETGSGRGAVGRMAGRDQRKVEEGLRAILA